MPTDPNPIDKHHQPAVKANGGLIDVRSFLFKGTIAVLGVSVVYAAVLYCLLYDKPEQRAVFGDMFGALNTAFSGLAFAGVIYAILLQRRELALQRKELKATRGELRRSAKAQDQAQLALNEQVEMLRETAGLQAAAREPHVIVYPLADESRSTILLLVIENIGGGVAKNIRFEVPDGCPLEAWGIERLSTKRDLDEGPLVTGIPSLPPGGNRRLNWGQYGGLNDCLADGVFAIRATFTDGRGKQVEPTVSLVDVRSYALTDITDPDGTRQSAEQLKRIAKDLGKLASGHQPVNVIVETRSGHRRRKEQERAVILQRGVATISTASDSKSPNPAKADSPPQAAQPKDPGPPSVSPALCAALPEET